MANFMIAYHGGKIPSSKEEGMAHKERWMKWIASLGDRVVNSGTPLMNSKLITKNSIEDDQNKDAMNGFAVISAEDIDDAISVAKEDPFLAMEGTIRISHMMEMK
jgi:hypothetical protein